jgi:hypothetical protein
MEERKRLHNEELHDLYSAPNIFNILWVIKSRRRRLARHVTHMRRSANRILLGNCEGRRPYEDTRHIWEHILRKQNGRTLN